MYYIALLLLILSFSSTYASGVFKFKEDKGLIKNYKNYLNSDKSILSHSSLLQKSKKSLLNNLFSIKNGKEKEESLQLIQLYRMELVPFISTEKSKSEFKEFLNSLELILKHPLSELLELGLKYDDLYRLIVRGDIYNSSIEQKNVVQLAKNIFSNLVHVVNKERLKSNPEEGVGTKYLLQLIHLYRMEFVPFISIEESKSEFKEFLNSLELELKYPLFDLLELGLKYDDLYRLIVRGDIYNSSIEQKNVVQLAKNIFSNLVHVVNKERLKSNPEEGVGTKYLLQLIHLYRMEFVPFISTEESKSEFKEFLNSLELELKYPLFDLLELGLKYDDLYRLIVRGDIYNSSIEQKNVVQLSENIFSNLVHIVNKERLKSNPEEGVGTKYLLQLIQLYRMEFVPFIPTEKSKSEFKEFLNSLELELKYPLFDLLELEHKYDDLYRLIVRGDIYNSSIEQKNVVQLAKNIFSNLVDVVNKERLKSTPEEWVGTKYLLQLIQLYRMEFVPFISTEKSKSEFKEFLNFLEMRLNFRNQISSNKPKNEEKYEIDSQIKILERRDHMHNVGYQTGIYFNPKWADYSINLLCINDSLDSKRTGICKESLEKNIIDSALTWKLKNHLGKVNIWFDKATTTEDQLKNTKNLIQVYAGQTDAIILRDVSEIEFVKKNFNILSVMPLYYFIDLLKLIILANQLIEEKVSYAIFTDASVKPMTKEELFSERYIKKLKIAGLLTNRLENQFLQAIQSDSVINALKMVINISLMRGEFAINMAEDEEFSFGGFVRNRSKIFESIYDSVYSETIEFFPVYHFVFSNGGAFHIINSSKKEDNSEISDDRVKDSKWIDYNSLKHGYYLFGQIVLIHKMKRKAFVVDKQGGVRPASYYIRFSAKNKTLRPIDKDEITIDHSRNDILVRLGHSRKEKAPEKIKTKLIFKPWE